MLSVRPLVSISFNTALHKWISLELSIKGTPSSFLSSQCGVPETSTARPSTEYFHREHPLQPIPVSCAIIWRTFRKVTHTPLAQVKEIVYPISFVVEADIIISL